MTFNISEFRSKVTAPQRANKFNLTIGKAPKGLNSSKVKELEFWCEGVNAPGVASLSSPIYTYGYGVAEAAPYGVQFSPVRAVFLLDQNGDNVTFFRDWLGLTVAWQTPDTMSTDAPSGLKPFEVGYKDDYVVPITITTWSDDGNTSATVNLEDAYPVSVDDLPLTWAPGAGLVRLGVTFAYTRIFATRTSSTS